MESFGRYQLLERLAVGGMAEIFHARSASLDGFEKDLVIKRIRSEFGADPVFSSLFIDEARVSISLSHQNLVQVFDFGQAEGCYYLAMEYVRGCDLTAILHLDEVEGAGLDPALALYVMGEVCRALDYAHNAVGRHGQPLNIVHRDISPQNVMVTWDGGVKVMDFGVASARGQLSRRQPGFVVGKLTYMSPEHATGMMIDQRSDIFAAGVVLWELLVGRPLHEGVTGEELRRRVRAGNIPPPSELNRKLPRKLDRLVLRAVAADPEERYQSARELGADIHAYLARRHPEVSSYTLQEFLDTRRDELAPRPEAVSAPSLGTRRIPREPTKTPAGRLVEQQGWAPRAVAAVDAFQRQPSLWKLLEVGAACADAGDAGSAAAVHRLAAVKFAQRGLFAQSLLCCRRMLAHVAMEDARALLESLPALAGCSNQEVAPHLFAADGPVEQALARLVEGADPTHGVVGMGTPLLRHLKGSSFAELARLAALRSFPSGTRIIEQGSTGRTMFLIAAGRVLVYAHTAGGSRVYLSSLTAGDFFGENGFFTSAPRSATVEALDDVEAFEIDLYLYERLMRDDQDANAILLYFYKERIVDVVLAKSSIFGLLSAEDRRALVDRFDLEWFQPGEVVIREGELSDDIYLIKDGEAEVFTEQGSERRILSTIGPGTLFGEVAALRQIPRTASVAARTRLETLRLGGAVFQAILDERPAVRQKVLGEVAQRVRENLDRLVHVKSS